MNGLIKLKLDQIDFHEPMVYVAILPFLLHVYALRTRGVFEN